MEDYGVPSTSPKRFILCYCHRCAEMHSAAAALYIAALYIAALVMPVIPAIMQQTMQRMHCNAMHSVSDWECKISPRLCCRW